MKQRKIVIAVSLALSLAQQSVEAQFDPVLNLGELNGENGFVINGVAAGDEAGFSVGTAGDVNGDGIDDVIIGAASARPGGQINRGISYVVYGSSDSLPNPFNLSTINGLNGFSLIGEAARDRSGFSVSSAGDINGDGIDDLIIGAWGADPNGNDYAGSSYVIFGSASQMPNPFNLADLNGSNGFIINGITAFDRSGFAVKSAGDVNGDGIDDLVIGAPLADPNGLDRAGSSYVVFGSAIDFPNPLQLSSLNGVNGFTINGAAAVVESGNAVSSAGDVNGDGIDDLIVGAYFADSNGLNDTGRSYVVFGSDNGLPNPFNLSTIDGNNGIVINGVAANDYSGQSVSKAGDVNGDGIDDFMISSAAADPNGNGSAGSSYVVFGSEAGLPNPFNLSTVNGVNGFTLNGVNVEDYSGISISTAGDVNGDGIDDIIIGASEADPNGLDKAGSSYVVFGTDTGFPNPFSLSSLNGSNGFIINGAAGDRSGQSVSAAGDVNGDGIDDVIIGASGANPNGNDNAGGSYVVFGNDGIFNNNFE